MKVAPSPTRVTLVAKPLVPVRASPVSCRTHARRPVAMRAQAQQEEEPAATGGGFFSSAFKNALSAALERSTDDIDEDLDPATLSRPAYVEPPQASAQEDMLGAALEASKTSLSRLMAIRNEVERAIERERTQVERLEFAFDKAKKDEAYYRVLRVVQDRGNSDIE